MPQAAAATVGRSRSKVRIPSLKPSPSGPIRFSSGTQQPENPSSPKGWGEERIWGPRKESPGAPASTRKQERPRLLAARSVAAKTTWKSAIPALEMKVL